MTDRPSVWTPERYLQDCEEQAESARRRALERSARTDPQPRDVLAKGGVVRTVLSVADGNVIYEATWERKRGPRRGTKRVCSGNRCTTIGAWIHWAVHGADVIRKGKS